MNSKEHLLQNDDVLICADACDPLNGGTKEEFVQKLRSVLTGKVCEAYIFGSFTSDRFSPDSDIDILLVAQTDRAFHKRFMDFNEVFDLTPALDILIYTPEEFAEIKKAGTAGFWKSVFSTELKII